MEASSYWLGRRVFVTGCMGFLGTAVTRELLARGAEVVGLVRDRARTQRFARECDEKRFYVVHGVVEDAIRLHTAMAVHDVSAVFHFADSTRGTDALLRAARLHDPRMPVVTSRPAMQLRLTAASLPAVPLGVARFGELFGGGDRKTTRVVPRTAIALLEGNSLPAVDGPARDFVHVHDAARACLLVTEAVEADGHALDRTFRTGWEWTDSAMAAALADVFAERFSEPRSESPENPLAWRPTISLRDALTETIDWYREFLQTQIGAHSTNLRKAA